MNMLLSKKEELDDVIEQAYDMIMNNNNKWFYLFHENKSEV
jgi:hypothetical protein